VERLRRAPHYRPGVRDPQALARDPTAPVLLPPARIIATTLVATLAGVATVAVGVLLYHTHLSATSALGLLVVFVLGAAAWAAAATALTSAIPTVEAASGILTLIYFPAIIISGVLGAIDEPHWLHTLATYLPAQPVIRGAASALRHAPGAPLLPAHDMIVLAAWIVVGLAAAVVTFRWEPHRPTQRRGAAPGRDGNTASTISP
jgi:ABC-2 type transport system permease protein